MKSNEQLRGSFFWVCGWNLRSDHSNESLFLSSTFLWNCLLCCTNWFLLFSLWLKSLVWPFKWKLLSKMLARCRTFVERGHLKRNIELHSVSGRLLIYLWKVHVVWIIDLNVDCSSSVTGTTRDKGAQCLNSLKAVKTLLVKHARGGCRNNSTGGWRSPLSSGCGQRDSFYFENSKMKRFS